MTPQSGPPVKIAFTNGCAVPVKSHAIYDFFEKNGVAMFDIPQEVMHMYAPNPNNSIMYETNRAIETETDWVGTLKEDLRQLSSGVNELQNRKEPVDTLVDSLRENVLEYYSGPTKVVDHVYPDHSPGVYRKFCQCRVCQNARERIPWIRDRVYSSPTDKLEERTTFTNIIRDACIAAIREVNKIEEIWGIPITPLTYSVIDDRIVCTTTRRK